MKLQCPATCCLSLLTILILRGVYANDTDKPSSSSASPKKKKSLLDYNDADMERIYDEWEVGE